MEALGGRPSTHLSSSLLAFALAHGRFNHWFDGMALLHQFEIEDGAVKYRSKFLRSDSYTANSENNRIMISEFGTLAMPDPCKSVFERFMSKFEVPGKCPPSTHFAHDLSFPGSWSLGKPWQEMDGVCRLVLPCRGGGRGGHAGFSPKWN